VLPDVNHLCLPESWVAVRSWARWATGRLLAVAAGGHETTPRQPLARRRRMARQRRTPCPELMTPTRRCAKPSNITWPPEHRRTLTHSRSRSSALQRRLRPWPRYGLRGDAWCLHAHLFLGPRPSSRSAAEVAPGVRLDKWGRGPTWGHGRSCSGLRSLRASAGPVQSLFVVAADP